MFKLIWNRKRRYRWYHLQTVADRRAGILRLLLLLLFLFVIHVAVLLLVEGMGVWSAIWLTMTTLTTVGYGDHSAGTFVGQLATIVLLYLSGIFVLAQIAGEWIDYRVDRRNNMITGQWNWNMKDHLVIINSPDADGDRYLRILVNQVRQSPSTRDAPIQIFTPHYPNGLPSELRSLGVVHRHGAPEGPDSLELVDVSSASMILVLAEDASAARSDSVTLDVLIQLRELNVSGYVIAECVQDENRDRFRRAGANAVLRPIRAYPELMARAIEARGTEIILENLFSREGVYPHRYDLSVEQKTWSELAVCCIQGGVGTLVGYEDRQHRVVINPGPDEQVSACAVFLLVNHDQVPGAAELEACIAR